MPAGDTAPRVPADLGVIMRVQVDEARGDDQPIRVDDLVRDAVGPSADLGDPPVLDPHVAAKARDPGPVDNRSTLDVDVVIGHLHPRLGVVSQLLPTPVLTCHRIHSWLTIKCQGSRLRGRPTEPPS